MKTWRDVNILCNRSTMHHWNQRARQISRSLAAFLMPCGFIIILLLLPFSIPSGVAGPGYVPPVVTSAVTPALPPTAIPGVDQIDLTTGWKTYDNPSYGYRLKYPADWGLREWENPAVPPTPTLPPTGLDVTAPGCSSPQWDLDSGGGVSLHCWNNVYVVSIDLRNPEVEVRPAEVYRPNPLSSIADGDTIAVINGDYTDYGCSGTRCAQGLFYINGNDKTNRDKLCRDALKRRVLALSADGRPLIDWWYALVDNPQSICSNLVEGGGWATNYRYHVVSGGPQITFDGAFRWNTGTCVNDDYVINEEHFKCDAANWWNRNGTFVGYTSDGNRLLFAVTNGAVNPQVVHDVLWQTAQHHGQTLKSALKYDGGSVSGLYYRRNPTYSINPNVSVANAWVVRRRTAPPPPPPPSCNPNTDQIALFVDGNYSGQCVVKGIGEYPNPGAIGLPNDSISSIKVGGNVQAILCRDDNYGGGCETFTTDDSNLSDNSVGNDQVSSAKVELRPSPCNPNADQVALFVDADYRGQCVIKGLGEYPNPGAIGLPNDSISSVKVGGNVKAILCRDDNYGGGCETFTSDDSNLSDNSIGNDQVSSAKVEQRLQPPNAPSNLSATAVSASQINLSWQDNSGDETGFNIYRNGSYLTSVGANVTSYQNTGLNPCTSYSYYVKAYNSAGESGFSNPATATTQGCGPAITVDGVSVDWCQGGGASVQEISAEPLPVPIKVEGLQTQSAAQPSGTFQIGRKICMGIGATNHTASAISTYWSWTTYNSSGVKIQQLSYDDWPWTMNPGGAGAGWGPTIPYNLTPGLYTFVGSIRYDSSTASRSTTFSIIGVYGDSADFDGDGRVDPAVWNPANGKWSIKGSKGQNFFPTWGGQGNIPVPGDYDGDGKTDIATWNPANGKWYIKGSKEQNLFPTWGGQNDIPVPGDYDGDGKTDIAIWNPASGKWSIKGSKGQNLFPTWGGQNNIPVPGDYDGDGKTDIATWNPASGKWYIKGSKGQNLFPIWGGQGNVPVPGDYDGDAKTDIATWNPANGKWYIKGSKGQNLFPIWGGQGNVPVPGDYDGDGKTDIATWNPANGKWYIKGSKGQNLFPIWGGQNNIPVSAP